MTQRFMRGALVTMMMCMLRVIIKDQIGYLPMVLDQQNQCPTIANCEMQTLCKSILTHQGNCLMNK